MKIDIWRIISWIFVLYGITYNYINISESIKRGLAFIGIIYLIVYSIFLVFCKIKNKH